MENETIGQYRILRQLGARRWGERVPTLPLRRGSSRVNRLLSKLIPQPKRSATGYRTYDQQIAQLVRFTRRAQLAEVRQLLELRLDPRRSCSEVKPEAETKIEAIDSKIAELWPTSACPILDAIDNT